MAVASDRLRSAAFERRTSGFRMHGYWRQAALCLFASVATLVAAQDLRPALQGAPPGMSEAAVSAWLLRLHNASRERNYVGTFVVSSASGALASARIWHACEGEQQIERVEALTGAPRSIFRHNDRVVTFLPDVKVARTERRESLGAFPGLLKSLDASITDFYSVHPAGNARVAGFEADVVELMPKDKLRLGYRVWSEKASALVLKVQTLDTEGRVLEQAAFSELEFDAKVEMDKLAGMMAATDGWKIETPVMVKTAAETMGWALEAPVPGFKPVHCYRRSLGAGAGSGRNAVAESAMHWVFSDGLASVSLFVEPFDPERHAHPGQMEIGATRTVTRRVGGDSKGFSAGDWWLTAVGEVPYRTLQMFGQNLRRVDGTR